MMKNTVDYIYKQKHFFINDFEKWLVQNQGEIIDCYEGCLLDNYVIACKNGIAFVFEEYATCWSSKYHCYFFRNNETETDGYKEIEKQWYDNYDEYWRIAENE